MWSKGLKFIIWLHMNFYNDCADSSLTDICYWYSNISDIPIFQAMHINFYCSADVHIWNLLFVSVNPWMIYTSQFLSFIFANKGSLISFNFSLQFNPIWASTISCLLRGFWMRGISFVRSIERAMNCYRNC